MSFTKKNSVSVSLFYGFSAKVHRLIQVHGCERVVEVGLGLLLTIHASESET